MPWPRRLSRTVAGAALRIDKGSQIIEPVGGYRACRDQFPQRSFDFCFQPTRAAYNIRKKRRATLAQECRNFTGCLTQTLLRFLARFAARGIIQSESSRTKNVNRSNARVGTTRRPSTVTVSSVAGCGESRPHPTAPVRHR